MSSGLAFDLSIDPNPRFVSTVRRFVEEAFDRLLPDPDAVFRVSMTARAPSASPASTRTVTAPSSLRPTGIRAPGNSW